GRAGGLVDLERLAAAVAAAVVAVARVAGLVAVRAGLQVGAERGVGHRAVGGDRLGLAGRGGAGAVVGRVQVVGEGAGQAERVVAAGQRARVEYRDAAAGEAGVVDRGRAVLDRGAGRAGGLVDLERLAAAVAAAVVAVARVAGLVAVRAGLQVGAVSLHDALPICGDRLGLAGRGGAGAVVGRVQVVGEGAGQAERVV